MDGGETGTGTGWWRNGQGVSGEMASDRDTLWVRKGLLCVLCCFSCFLLSTPHSAVTFPPESKLINVTFSSLFLLWVMHPPPVP